MIQMNADHANTYDIEHWEVGEHTPLPKYHGVLLSVLENMDNSWAFNNRHFHH